jgi:hypothetical protein
MPQGKRRAPLPEHHADPLAAVLDADGTYICTAYNSRCYIIQKVRLASHMSGVGGGTEGLPRVSRLGPRRPRSPLSALRLSPSEGAYSLEFAGASLLSLGLAILDR